METQISNPTPDGGSAATPATDPASANGTVQPGGDANGQRASAEEMFGNVDPKTLPPALKSVYDNMLRGFKEKTTKLSETVKSETAKAVEAYRQRADLYDQFSGRQDFVQQWNEYVQKSQQPDGQQSDPVQQKLQEFETKLQQNELKLRTSETLQVINAFADAKDEKGNLIHADFDKLSSLKIGTHAKSGEYDLLRTAIELAPGNTPQEKMENGYKAAKATYDAIFEEGRKSGMGRLQEKVRNGSLPPSGSSNAQATASRQPKNALEALQFARQGLAPSR